MPVKVNHEVKTTCCAADLPKNPMETDGHCLFCSTGTTGVVDLLQQLPSHIRDQDSQWISLSVLVIIKRRRAKWPPIFRCTSSGSE